MLLPRQSGSEESGAHRRYRRLGVPLLAGVVVAVACIGGALLSSASAPASATNSPCQFQKADHPTNVAPVRDLRSARRGSANRSGDLEAPLWGVSRQIGLTNFGQGSTTTAVADDIAEVRPERAGATSERCRHLQRTTGGSGVPTREASPRWRCIRSSRLTSLGGPERSRST